MSRFHPRALVLRPLVSVVIPCYNYGRFLPRAVGSALSQPAVDVEVIIVDDASPDGSGREAERLAAADPRVTAVLHTVNAGHIATYNDGLARCNGDYIVLLSADDLLASGALERSAALFEAHPDVALVYGRAPSFASEPPIERVHRLSWSVWSGPAWIDRICRQATNVIANPEAVVRRDVVERFGGYDKAFPHTADFLFWLRAASVGAVGRIGGPSQAYYRIHGSNMHLRENELSDLMERSRMFEAFLSTYVGPELLVRRALAEEALARAVREHDLGRGQEALATHFVEFAKAQGVPLSALKAWPSFRRREALARRGLHSAFLSLSGRVLRRAHTARTFARLRRTGVV